MSTISLEAETNKNANTSTERKSTLTISQNLEKAVTDEEKATGLAATHFLSSIAISIMFVPFFVNA